MVVSLSERVVEKGLLLSGSFVGSDYEKGEGTFAVEDPASGETLMHVSNGTEVTSMRGIEVAAQGFESWRYSNIDDRSRNLISVAALMDKHAEDLATILTLEMGKPLAEARSEIAYSASYFRWFAEEAKRACGQTSPGGALNRLTLKQPVGVCAAVTPWNFPSAMVARKIAPAIAAGCSVLVKPSELTPMSALALGEICLRAGLPEGVVNIVVGTDAEAIVQPWMASPIVRKLTFTGSTVVGRKLMASAAPTLKRLSLELGGNAPFLVFDDCDLDGAVEGVMAAKFRNAGQTCVCVNRIYVQSAIYDDFIDRLATAVGSLKLGCGLDPATDIGPLINQAAVRKVEAHISDALAGGAQIVCGGSRQDESLFFPPTLIRDVACDALCMREEIFGPLAPVIRFEDDDEGLKAANSSEYGLAAYACVGGLQRARYVIEKLEAGMVGINTGVISSVEMPFGGIKQSGFGREGGVSGLEEYLQTKAVTMNELNA